MTTTVRAATAADVPLLAAMNGRLIQDEGSRNPMDEAALRERMAGWLAAGWRADLICEDGRAVGYALYQVRSDEYFPEHPLVYLRQFFVERDRRGRGTGGRALGLLREARFPAEAYVVIDVLAGNARGRRFWERNGFTPYATTMHWGAPPRVPVRPPGGGGAAASPAPSGASTPARPPA